MEKLHQHALQRACAQQSSHLGGCLPGHCTRRCADQVTDAAFLTQFHAVLTEYLDEVMLEDVSLS